MAHAHTHTHIYAQAALLCGTARPKGESVYVCVCGYNGERCTYLMHDDLEHRRIQTHTHTHIYSGRVIGNFCVSAIYAICALSLSLSPHASSMHNKFISRRQHQFIYGGRNATHERRRRRRQYSRRRRRRRTTTTTTTTVSSAQIQ